jgi:septal ring factor EnvC (AmiA/AmiB activator)
MPPPQNADGSITSNRQTNDEDAARRAGFEPDSADEEMNELERTNPDDASEKDQGEIDDLDAELAKLDEQLAAEEEELNERRRRAERVRAQRDALVERRDRKVDPQADMKDRLAFIKRQTAARAERAGDDRLARELAMQSRGIGSSPLDQSLATRPRPRRDLPKAE